MQRKHLIMIAVSLAFFFATATTFTSLALVLYTMVADLHWSHATAGFSFSLLGLVCGLSSPLPPLAMKWFGSRGTMLLGGLVMALSFFLASLAQGIGVFFVATGLMGAGFTLLAPAPGVYLIANWFPQATSRLLGYYFMLGAFGGVVGPVLGRSIIALDGGDWRMYWRVMAVAALLLAGFCAIAVRDTSKIRDADEVRNAGLQDQAATPAVRWTVREALLSRQFIVLSLALLVVQTAVTTLHSMLVTQIGFVGGGASWGAAAMSMLALSGTLTKGVIGRVAERRDPKQLMVVGLGLQFIGFLLLIAVPQLWAALLFAVVFGVGWGVSWLSAHVLLVKYFGSAIAGTMVAMATMMTTFAVIGPYSAGLVADSRGSFMPIFVTFAALLALVTLSTQFFLHPPQRESGGAMPPIDASGDAPRAIAVAE